MTSQILLLYFYTKLSILVSKEFASWPVAIQCVWQGPDVWSHSGTSGNTGHLVGIWWVPVVPPAAQSQELYIISEDDNLSPVWELGDRHLCMRDILLTFVKRTDTQVACHWRTSVNCDFLIYQVVEMIEDLFTRDIFSLSQYFWVAYCGKCFHLDTKKVIDIEGKCWLKRWLTAEQNGWHFADIFKCIFFFIRNVYVAYNFTFYPHHSTYCYPLKQNPKSVPVDNNKLNGLGNGLVPYKYQVISCLKS